MTGVDSATAVIPSERSESRDLHLWFLTESTESTEDVLGVRFVPAAVSRGGAERSGTIRFDRQGPQNRAADD